MSTPLRIHLDTSFLVDLLREARRGSPGPATGFLEAHRETPLAISAMVACELEAGVACARDPEAERAALSRLLSALELVGIAAGFPERYGALFGELRARGESVATMDLLIATCALLEGAALVTRNVRDFERVPGLRVLRY